MFTCAVSFAKLLRTSATQEMGRCKLVVKIVGARGLIPRVGQGSPSAYVELCFDGQRFHTAIKVKDQYPMWNETFYFDVSDPSNMHELVLEASVYDTNTSIATTPRRVYFLGKVTQNGASFRRFYGKQQSSKAPLALYPLEKQSEMLLVGACAELLLTAYILDETPMRAQLPNISSPCSAPMGLCVEVISAIDLSPRDEQGSTSSCVELFFDNCRHCTAIKEIDILPEWDERFYFHVWDPPNLSKLDIRAYVYYVDSSLRRPKTLLGMVRIPGYSFRPLSDALSLYYPLESPGVSLGKKGELRLKVYTIANPSMRTSNPSPPMDSAIRSSPDLYVSNTLESILQIRSSGPHGVPLQHLKAITNNFSEERMLGQGAIGAVYKGVLQNGEMVAVKKIMSSLMPGQKQFENEVYRLMKLNHPNIVQFLGFCYETRNVCIECDGKHVFAEIADRLLCLEYLPEGSLDKHITDADKSELDWSTRYNIIEGICYGLCHLHDENDKPILHLDLKPPNILLSVGMVPKITDFGLSRRLDQQQTIYTSSHDGTLGYMAPELIHGGTITPKSDIFSLGVIIIEVVTGQKNYPYAITKASSDEYIKLELEKWIDVLEKSPGYGSLETDCEQIRRCIQVGLICMNPDRTKRPPIAKVISMLQGSESIDSCAHWE